LKVVILSFHPEAAGEEAMAGGGALFERRCEQCQVLMELDLSIPFIENIR